MFMIIWTTNIILITLTKLTNFILRLNEITVKGDEVFNDTAGPRTRSTRSSRPAQFSMVPLLAKLTKLLLMEVNEIKSW